MTGANKNYKSLQKLAVIYRGWGEEWVLGNLAQLPNHRGWLFEYTSEAIKTGIEFSPIRLPLATDTYTNFEFHQQWLPGFVSDSLPDGWGWLLMDRLLRRSGVAVENVSVLDRLALLNENAIGALAYRPLHTVLTENSNERNILDLFDLAKQIKYEVNGQDSDMLRELVRLGGSPHGARPKALVEYDPITGKMATTPFAGSEPWLFKFPAAMEQTWVCALEEVYAQMARMAGIEFPVSHYFRLDKQLAAFGGQRFDRVAGMCIPVLSMAGALHADFRLPCLDYTTIIKATSLITRSVIERETQARRMVFNIVMNNRDDHAKNFSFILTEDKEWKVSPAYDLTFQSGPGGQHQTSIAGYGSEIPRSALLDVAGKVDIKPMTMNRIIDEVVDVAAKFVQIAEAFSDDIPQNEINMIMQRINQNIQALKKLLG